MLLNDLFLFQRLLLIWPVSNRILSILKEPHTVLQAQTYYGHYSVPVHEKQATHSSCYNWRTH